MTGVACPIPILQFFNNAGQFNVGGSVLTQVGGVNAPTYQDVGLTTALPNPIPLNSRGEISDASGHSQQLFLPANTAYAFTIFDARGNQLDQAIYVNGVQFVLNAAEVAAALYPPTPAEDALGVTPLQPYPAYTILRYVGNVPNSINGTIDVTSAMQTAINCAQQAQYAMVTVGLPGATLKVGSAWTIDTNRTGIDFQGALVNASTFTSGNWLTIVQSAGDVNARPLLNAAHPIQNAIWQGPGQQNTTAVCQYLVDAVLSSIAGVRTVNIAFRDWGQDIIEGQGAFANTWLNCTFAPTTAGSSGAATTYSYSRASGTNSGERDTFIGCWWYNKALICDAEQAAGDTYFDDCSFDFFTRAFNVGGAARVIVNNSHIESPFDTDNWVFVTGANSSFTLVNSEISVDVDKNAFDLMWSDPTCTNGGIFLDNVLLEVGGNTWTKDLLGGGGNARVRNLIQDASAVHPTIGQSVNMLAYPDFESANYAGDWTLSGGAVRSTAQHHGGAASLSFPGTSSTTPAALFSRACRQGQQIQGELWYLLPTGTATAGTFTVATRFVDAGNNVIASFANLTSVATVTSWTKIAIGAATPAPPGTASVQISVSLFGVTAGTPIGYIDDAIFNLVE